MQSNALTFSCTHVYTQRTVWYSLQVTQGHHSPSTGDDGQESTNRSLPVLFLLVWRSRVLSGDTRDVKQSHLSRWLSCSAAISHSYWIDFTSIGPLVINKEMKQSLQAHIEAAYMSHMDRNEFTRMSCIPVAVFMNACEQDTRVCGLRNKSFFSWSKGNQARWCNISLLMSNIFI